MWLGRIGFWPDKFGDEVPREPGFWGWFWGSARTWAVRGFGVQREPVGGCGWEELGFGPINSGTRFSPNLGARAWGFGV